LLLLLLLLFDVEVADSEGGFSFKPSSSPNHFFATFRTGLSAGVFALVSLLAETALPLGSNPHDFFGFTALGLITAGFCELALVVSGDAPFRETLHQRFLSLATSLKSGASALESREADECKGADRASDFDEVLFVAGLIGFLLCSTVFFSTVFFSRVLFLENQPAFLGIGASNPWSRSLVSASTSEKSGPSLGSECHFGNRKAGILRAGSEIRSSRLALPVAASLELDSVSRSRSAG